VTVAVILAAGRSLRMGRSKALLPYLEGSSTFLTHLVEQFRTAGFGHILVVGRIDDQPLRDETAAAGAALVVNPNPDAGQLSSLLCGLEAADRLGAQAIAVIPVDVPMVSAGAIARLVRDAEANPAPIVRATYAGQHGHPVIFKRAVFDELRRADPAVGARAVVRADPSRVADVDAGEAGVTIDVDTPEDYENAFKRPL
jgi:molybdenum cofactor cytidylyltransferase